MTTRSEAKRRREAQAPAQRARLVGGQAVALDRRLARSSWRASRPPGVMRLGQAPLGPALLQPSGPAPTLGLQATDRLVRVGAERTAAVGDDLAVRRAARPGVAPAPRAGSSGRPRCGRRRTPRAGRTSTSNGVAARQPLEQLLAPDRLDVLAEVVARGALDLGEPSGRGVAQRQPERQRLLAGECVADPRAFARPASTIPAACRACRCWEALAVDWPLARASSSTLRGACASRSSNSSRRGLANALPITAIASNSACFRRLLHPCFVIQ